MLQLPVLEAPMSHKCLTVYALAAKLRICHTPRGGVLQGRIRQKEKVKIKNTYLSEIRLTSNSKKHRKVKNLLHLYR